MHQFVESIIELLGLDCADSGKMTAQELLSGFSVIR